MSPSPTPRRAPFPWLALVAVSIWGASFPAIRLALESFEPFALAAIRFGVGFTLLALLLRASGRGLLPRSRDRLRCVLLGVVLAVHMSIQAHGLVYTSAIHTGWIIGFTPAVIAVGARIAFGERLSWWGWAGFGVSTLGVLGVSLSALPDLENAHWGDLLQVVSCFTWTIYTLGGIEPVARNGALTVTTFAMGVAALVLLPVPFFTGLTSGPVSASSLLAIAFLGIVCSGVGLSLWLRAQRECGAQRVGATLYFEPFTTLIAATVLLGERITPRALVSGLVVLFGVWLVGRATRSSR